MQHTRKRAGLLKSALLGAATLGALSLAGAGVAQANPVAIGFATTGAGASPTSVIEASNYVGGSNPSSNSYTTNAGYANFSGTVGSASFTADTGTGIPNLGPSLLLNGSVNSLTFSAVNNTDNTFWVYITESGLTSPLGTFQIDNALTAASLSGVVTGSAANISSIVEATYVSQGTPSFGSGFDPGTQLATRTFTSGGSAVGGQGSGAGGVVATTPDLTSGYSLTEVFAFTATANTTGATASGQIHMSTVPEPGSLALLGTGLLGLGFVMRRRHRKA